MNKLPPVFDPYTCIHTTHGFSLFIHEREPWVVRTYSKRKKLEDGTFRSEKFVEHLRFDQEWPSGPVATDAKRELQQAWADWTSWQSANGKR